MLPRNRRGRRTADAVQLALVGATSGLTPREHAAALRLVEGSNREADVAVARLLAALPPRETRWGRRRQAAVAVAALGLDLLLLAVVRAESDRLRSRPDAAPHAVEVSVGRR